MASSNTLDITEMESPVDRLERLQEDVLRKLNDLNDEVLRLLEQAGKTGIYNNAGG